MNNIMKLYCWTDLPSLTDYYSGLLVVMAPDLDTAMSLAVDAVHPFRKDLSENYTTDRRVELAKELIAYPPEVSDKPVCRWTCGGG